MKPASTGNIGCVPRHQQSCDQARPAGLMRGADAAAVVAIEILVKQQVITKVRILLRAGVLRMHGPQAVLTAQEYPRQPVRKLVSDFPDVDKATGSGRAF